MLSNSNRSEKAKGRYKFGEISMQSSQWEAAIKHFTFAFNEDNSIVNALYMCGKCFYQLSNDKDALNCMQQFVDLSKEPNEYTQNAIAVINELKGKLQSANECTKPTPADINESAIVTFSNQPPTGLFKPLAVKGVAPVTDVNMEPTMKSNITITGSSVWQRKI